MYIFPSLSSCVVCHKKRAQAHLAVMTYAKQLDKSSRTCLPVYLFTCLPGGLAAYQNGYESELDILRVSSTPVPRIYDTVGEFRSVVENRAFLS